MSEAGQRAWQFYLDDMIGFAEKVLSYTHGLDQSSFIASSLHYDATIRNLELIGEAATRIPDGVRSAYSDSLALDHCYPQSPDSWIPGNRQRYVVEHYSG